MEKMRLPRFLRFLGAAGLAAAVLLTAPGPSAGAQPPPPPPPPGCPDIEVIYARGSGEPPGVGGVGQAFVDALRAQAAPRSVNVYAVNYPASTNFGDRIEIARTVVDGIRDAGGRLVSTSANCPETEIVLGGFSQGATVAGYVTSAEVPAEVPAEYRSEIPDPLEPEIAENVAAVTLFGLPSDRFLADVGAPPVVIGPLYEPKTLELCVPDDTICNGAAVGGPSFAHASYGFNGSVNEAATYVVGRLQP